MELFPNLKPKYLTAYIYLGQMYFFSQRKRMNKMYQHIFQLNATRISEIITLYNM